MNILPKFRETSSYARWRMSVSEVSSFLLPMEVRVALHEGGLLDTEFVAFDGVPKSDHSEGGFKAASNPSAST